MCDTGNFCDSSKEKIYTLAQSGTQHDDEKLSGVLVSGDGTYISDNPVLKNRAKRKVISREMLLNLIDIATEKGHFDRVQSYWNSYHCLNEVIISDNIMYGKYCKNRFCTICSAIRKAEMINKYYPVLSQWEDPQFVTLTVKSCQAYKLERWIKKVVRAFELIHNRCKKRYQRGKGPKIIGIKSLECNFNPIKRTYNPHFHIIVPNKEIAILLKREWLNQWRPKDPSVYRYKYTRPRSQYIVPINNIENVLIEIIKYGSKIFTEPDLNKKANKKIPPKIYAFALDNIFAAMKGKRIFDRFGFNLPKQNEVPKIIKEVKNYERWEFPSNGVDWVNPNTGELLTGYVLPSKLNHLLSECIDTELF